MKWIFRILIVTSALLSIIAVIGWLLDESHTVSRWSKYNQSPETVWEVITDYQQFPSWRPDVKKVKQMQDHKGRTVWREFYRGDKFLTLLVTESQEPVRLVTEIADEDLPFGGSWVYQIRGGENYCELKITEYGKVYNPFFRFIGRFIIGYSVTIENYLAALDKRLKS